MSPNKKLCANVLFEVGVCGTLISNDFCVFVVDTFECISPLLWIETGSSLSLSFLDTKSTLLVFEGDNALANNELFVSATVPFDVGLSSFERVDEIESNKLNCNMDGVSSRTINESSSADIFYSISFFFGLQLFRTTKKYQHFFYPTDFQIPSFYKNLFNLET